MNNQLSNFGNLNEIKPSGKIVMNIKDLTIGYEKELATINLEVIRGKKIGIIGKNGIGKSTLLKTIYGLIKPIKGEIELGINLKVGYFDQNLAMQDSNNTIIDEFRNCLKDLSYEQARSALGSFLFKDDDVNKKINVLSGGEKVRLQLCKILYDKPNLLLLDEPTNHMDIIGKEHLEDILKDYTGTLIFVSHDRYFVNKLADELLVFENNKVSYYRYGYSEYEEKRKQQELVVSEKQEIKKEKINNYNLNKEIKIIEKEITNKENELNKLNSELYKEEVYTDYEKSKEINDLIINIKKELDELNAKWESMINKI